MSYDPNQQQTHRPVPQQPYAGPPPGYYPPQRLAKQRRKWPWIVGGVLLFGLIGCLGLFTLVLGGTKAAVDGLDNNVKGKNAAVGKMNTPARDGKFQFTVTDFHCGLSRVGPDDFGQKAQGEFCLVNVRVKNIGTTVEVLVDASQLAYDAAGVEFSVDSGSAVWVNKEYSTFLESINPGNEVKGVLVFDVPKGTKLDHLVLHESMFSAGVKVPLK